MIRSKYQETISPYYAASGPGLDRGRLDAVIYPLETRGACSGLDPGWVSLGIEAAAQSPATRGLIWGCFKPDHEAGLELATRYLGGCAHRLFDCTVRTGHVRRWALHTMDNVPMKIEAESRSPATGAFNMGVLQT